MCAVLPYYALLALLYTVTFKSIFFLEYRLPRLTDYMSLLIFSHYKLMIIRTLLVVVLTIS